MIGVKVTPTARSSIYGHYFNRCTRLLILVVFSTDVGYGITEIHSDS